VNGRHNAPAGRSTAGERTSAPVGWEVEWVSESEKNLWHLLGLEPWTNHLKLTVVML
jgi:hypothetical protein